jgi:hypothetical protein
LLVANKINLLLANKIEHKTFELTTWNETYCKKGNDDSFSNKKLQTGHHQNIYPKNKNMKWLLSWQTKQQLKISRKNENCWQTTA